MTGRVALVGAGPGDPGLLTLRGAELLAQADVVLYDRLVGPQVLARIPPGTERIYVGKEPGGRRATSQEEIERLLIERARRGQLVVRLKGGDPFVFGRGGEEALSCRRAGVPFEVVPGVSSAVAGPAYAGIPLTQRGLAQSFAVLAAHGGDAAARAALGQAARGIDTLVFLMGMEGLPDLVQALLAAGRDPAEPAAVVSRATLPAQRSLRTTLGRLPDEAARAGLLPPAVVVVGQVAALADVLSWFPESAPPGAAGEVP